MQRRNFRNRVSIVSVLLASALAAPVALAQPKQPAKPPSSAPSTPGNPSKDDVARATAAFTQGTKFFQKKQINLALEQFKLSYDTVPSPNSHLYIARCQNELGDYKEAFRTFQKVVVEADQRAATEPKYAPTRDSAKTEIEDVAAKIGVLTVNVPSTDPNARLKLNGAVVPREDWGKEMAVDPGQLTLTLEVPGQDPITKKVDLLRGVKQSVTIDKVVAPPPVTPPPVEPVRTTQSSGPFLPLAIVGGAIGVAGMVTFGVAGGLSKSTYSKLETECGGAHACADHSHDSEISKGKTQQTIANVGLGVGVVGLVAGGGFLVAALVTGKSKPVEAKPAAGVRISPQIAPGYAGVDGTF